MGVNVFDYGKRQKSVFVWSKLDTDEFTKIEKKTQVGFGDDCSDKLTRKTH